MKKALFILALAATAAPAMTGCAYSGASALGADKVVITKDGIFGLIREVYVCKVTNDGVSACQSADKP